MLWTKTTSGPSPAVWKTMLTPSESADPSVAVIDSPRQSSMVTSATALDGTRPIAAATTSPHQNLMPFPLTARCDAPTRTHDPCGAPVVRRSAILNSSPDGAT